MVKRHKSRNGERNKNTEHQKSEKLQETKYKAKGKTIGVVSEKNLVGSRSHRKQTITSNRRNQTIATYKSIEVPFGTEKFSRSHMFFFEYISQTFEEIRLDETNNQDKKGLKVNRKRRRLTEKKTKNQKYLVRRSLQKFEIKF